MNAIDKFAFPSHAHARAVSRLDQEPHRRQPARPARADARGAAHQWRARVALRHLRPLHRPRRRHRRAARPARCARLDRRARRHRKLRRPRTAALDDGATHADRDAQRSPNCAPKPPRCSARRAAPSRAPTSRRCTTRAAASSRRRWNTSPSARTAGANGWPSTWPTNAREKRLAGNPMGAQHPAHRHARVRARRGGARPRHHPGQHQPPRGRADGDRPQLPGQDQRQHRQLGRHLEHRGRGREAGVGDPLGRRQRDGPVHRPQHPHHARLDRAQHPGADRHGADLPGAGEGRRRGRRPHLGDLPRHADRAGRAGRRLLHHPCRPAPALHPPHGGPAHRHRLARRLDHGQVVHLAPQGELPLHALRGHLRHHEGVRRELLARRRPAPRLRVRCQRRGAVRRAAHAGRAARRSPGSTTCRP